MNKRENFFTVKGNQDYEFVLSRVQTELSSKLNNDNVSEFSSSDLKNEIIKIIQNSHIKCDYTDDIDELAERLYHDMSGWSFISRYDLLNKEGFEELNINAWNDVDIIINGEMKKTSYSFLSPQQAIDVHKKMLNVSNTLINERQPYALADLKNNVRIAVLMSPVVDKNIGIVSSIRKVESKTSTKESLIKYGSMTEEMLEFLEQAALYGVSMVFAGETGAGKTYISGYILSQAAKKRRTFTIEESSREWDFIIRDDKGKARNSVVHAKTYEQDNDKANSVDQNRLLEMALRLDPNIIGVGEMRSSEAYTACEASNTGHTVISTTHSESALDTPYRIMALAKKAYDFADATLLSMITKAFPIIVYCEKLADNKRKITEIAEVIGYKDGEVILNTLWKYEVTENIYFKEETEYGTKTKVETKGSFIKMNNVTYKLAQKMLKKGATKEFITKYTGGEKICEN